jgi:3-deoxy-7-phosphoheptulonate synthase
MIIMNADATQEQIDRITKEVEGYGLRAAVIKGDYRTVVALVGDEEKIPLDHFAALPGVKEARTVDMPYKLISREYNKLLEESEDAVVKVGDLKVGGEEPIFIAGPCAVESKEQIFRIAEEVKEAGAHILRGGVFKPRSSVHSFQGLGGGSREEAEEALDWMRAAGRKFGLPIVTEVRGETQVDLVAEYADILQIGARNMYDQDLLAAVAKKGKPVLYKRSFGAGIEEYLSFSEYIAAEGNKDIILCERGIVPMGKGKS